MKIMRIIMEVEEIIHKISNNNNHIDVHHQVIVMFLTGIQMVDLEIMIGRKVIVLEERMVDDLMDVLVTVQVLFQMLFWIIMQACIDDRLIEWVFCFLNFFFKLNLILFFRTPTYYQLRYASLKSLITQVLKLLNTQFVVESMN